MQESAELAAEDRHMLEIILHNAQRVNEVIETILRLSRQDLPKPKPLVLGPWLETLAQALRQAYVLAPHQLVVQVEPEGITVYADAGQLQQIIEVLCDNAVRHFGGRLEDVRIHLLAGITPESGGPFIEIQDNGPGIPQAQVDKLFEPFFTTRNEGTGLGLYIASQLSEANRIRLQYQAIPTGSCFRLSFPNPKRRELA
jgi:two-component system sensor histidine kinase PilS (NtrC family)